MNLPKLPILCLSLMLIGNHVLSMESEKKLGKDKDKASSFLSLRGAVRKSLEQGNNIDVDKQYGSIGITVLIDSAAHGDLEAIQYFLNKGANIDFTDRVGNTPLTTALFNRKHDVALFLLNKGAKHFTFDMYGNAANKELTFENPFKCDTKWPEDLLVALQGECSICLNEIKEIGHIYPCGHSVHKECTIERCPFCLK